MTAERSRVDWKLAVKVGQRVAKSPPPTTEYTARQATEQLLDGAQRAGQYVSDVTGLIVAASKPPAVQIIDRKQWVAAAAHSITAMMPSESGKASISGRFAALHTGALLGYVSTAILGQYDPFADAHLASPGGELAGALLLVQPNIIQVERALRVEPADFRLWVCLHEMTHRVQFTAAPWLRKYFQDQISTLVDSESLSFNDQLAAIREAVADEHRQPGIVGLIQVFQGPKERAALNNLLALGTLLEGHADHVMDGVGSQVVPTVATIRSLFDARRTSPRNPIARLLRAVMGMEAKSQQYIKGKIFVDAVVNSIGMERFNTVFSRPEMLPTLAEIDAPQSWITRTGALKL